MLTSPVLPYKLQRAELLEDGAPSIAPDHQSRRNPRRRSVSPFRPSSSTKASSSTQPSAESVSLSSSSLAMSQGVSFPESDQALNEEEEVIEEEEGLRSDQRLKQKAFSIFLRKKSEALTEASVSKTVSSSSKSKPEIAQVEKTASQRHKSPFRMRTMKLSEATIDKREESLTAPITRPCSSVAAEDGKTNPLSPPKAFTLRQANKKSEESAMVQASSASLLNNSEILRAGKNSSLRNTSPFRSRNTKVSRATIVQDDEEEASTGLNTLPDSSATAKKSGHLRGEETLNSQPAQKSFSFFALRQVIRKSEEIPEASSAVSVNSSELPQETTELQESSKALRRSQIAITNTHATADEASKIEKKKSSRSLTRKTRSENPAEMICVSMETEQRGNRTKTHSSSHTNIQRKPSEPVDSSAANILPQIHHETLHRSHPRTAPPSSRVLESNIDTSPLPSRRTSIGSEASPSASKIDSREASPSTFRRASVEARTRESSEWLRLMGDIIMWRHIPRSAFLFGFGFFISMSASRVQSVEFSVVSMIAYASLAYLAFKYIKSIFLKSQTPSSAHLLTEGDALKLIRLLLPPLNSILLKMGEIFSGEPTVTLKVAGVLWLLAKFGPNLNVWTFSRIVYFALFTLPKCYSRYNEHIERQNKFLLAWAKAKWKACGYKKTVLIVVVIIAWNLSSVSTRICGGFFVIVAIKAYWTVIRECELLQRGSNILSHGHFLSRTAIPTPQ